jgi:CMP-2-keto-3-deoxyoctulosonic acid synthetase
MKNRVTVASVVEADRERFSPNNIKVNVKGKDIGNVLQFCRHIIWFQTVP